VFSRKVFRCFFGFFANCNICEENFSRAAHIATGSLSQTESDKVTDLVFKIFDREEKGLLDRESFLYLMKNRQARSNSRSALNPYHNSRLASKQPLPLHLTVLFAWISASVAATCTFPLDKVKTRMQRFFLFFYPFLKL